jgi:hypothetical protein
MRRLSGTYDFASADFYARVLTGACQRSQPGRGRGWRGAVRPGSLGLSTLFASADLTVAATHHRQAASNKLLEGEAVSYRSCRDHGDTLRLL